MPTRTRLLPIATIGCLTALVLAGCTDTPEPEPTPTGMKTATPMPTAPAPTTTPEPTEGVSENPPVTTPDADDETEQQWKTITVYDWATVTVPADWKAVQDTRSENPERSDFLVDGEGNEHVSLYYGERDRTFNPPGCDTPETYYKNLTTVALPDAYPGEDLQLSTQVRELEIYNGDGTWEQRDEYVTRYSFESHLNEADRVDGTTCPPYAGIYPDAGGFISISIQPDPYDALYFKTKEGADRYFQSDEYKTIERVLKSIRINP